MMLIYMFTASSLVHASTMGFFGNHTATTHVSHCHESTDTATSKPSKQNMNCCELFTNDQYSQVHIDFHHQTKLF